MCEDPVMLLQTYDYGIHIGAFEENCLLESNVLYKRRSLTLQNSFCLLLLVSCFTYSSTLKLEEVRPSEKSVDFTRLYTSEDSTILWL
jgi:hypothetical protein